MAAALAPRAQAAALPYDAALEALVMAMVSPLIDVQAHSARPKIALAVGPLRELNSGRSSKLAMRLERDLARRIENDTVYKVPPNPGPGGADAAVIGSYAVQGSAVLLQLRLVRGKDGSEIWSDSQSFLLAESDVKDLDLIPGTEPEGFVPPQPVSATAEAEAAPATPSPTPFATPELVNENYEAGFSSNRIIVGLGWKGLYSQNPVFRSVVGDLASPYLRLSWADVVGIEFDMWSKHGTGLADAGSLSAFGTTLSLGAPLRLGTLVVLYAGLGGRFESISVGDTRLPSGDQVTYGNNSFFGALGLKLHRRRWGAEAVLARDVVAAYSPYLSLRLGLAYEFRLE
jgi:hypothetical protein